MPSDAVLEPLLLAQQSVLSRDQALRAGLTRRAIEHRLATRAWQRVLPRVYIVGLRRPSRVQAQIAALLHAGDGSALDDVDACICAGLTAVPFVKGRVFVAAPEQASARSHDFVVVRRVRKGFTPLVAGPLRYLEPAAALIAMSRRLKSCDRVLASFSEAVRRHLVTHDELVAAHLAGPPRHITFAADALEDTADGVWSVAEGWFRRLAIGCSRLPPLLYNRRLRLPDGRVIVPDALAVDAGLVHETNGRGPHEREDLFESMQERHDLMTAAGVTVLHNSPRRIRTRGQSVIGEFCTCYLALAGRGLPPGVVLLDD
jgi:hypothetical protein